LALAGGEVHLIYTDAEGNVFRRRQRMTSETEGGGWDTPQQISGLNQVSPPVGVTAGGAGTIHIVGVDADGEVLLYRAWDGGTWRDLGTFALDPQLGAGPGVWVTTMPQGERLAALLRITVTDKEENAMPTLHYMERVIPTVEVSPPPTRPTPLPLPTTIAEAAESKPTPTPDLSVGLEPSDAAVDPRLLGGSVAIVIIAAALATRSIWGRRR
jgi:hypothetical protein